MAKYRKKPVVIDAVQWDGKNISEAMPDWMKEPFNDGTIMRRGNEVDIVTLEGVMTAKPNDFIIRGVNGELYPCKPDIFEKTYEIAE
jgi:hypothetical protein